MADLIEEQREQLTALTEPERVEVSLKDYEQLDNLPKINGSTIIGNMTVKETIEISEASDASKYTPTQLITLRNSNFMFTYMGQPIIAESVYGTGEDTKFYFTYCVGGSDTTLMTTFWRKYVDTEKRIRTLNRTNLPLGVNGKTWASPSAEEITLVASDIKAESGWSPANDTDLATKKYVDNSIPSLTGYETTANKVTSLTDESSDTEYPSAKCVYDIIGDVESLLAELIGGESE